MLPATLYVLSKQRRMAQWRNTSIASGVRFPTCHLLSLLADAAIFRANAYRLLGVPIALRATVQQRIVVLQRNPGTVDDSTARPIHNLQDVVAVIRNVTGRDPEMVEISSQHTFAEQAKVREKHLPDHSLPSFLPQLGSL